MALLQPAGASWGYCTTNLSGTPSTTANGTLLVPGTGNANGGSAALISAITHDVELLVLGFANFFVTGVTNQVQVDIMLDPAGGTSWDTTNLLIPDLIVGGCPAQSGGVGLYYHFPIWIKSGSSIGARARTSAASSSNGRIFCHAYGGNRNPSSWWCGQKVEAIGTTAASSSGTSHTAGNSGAYSTWANFGSTTTYDANAVQFGVQSQLNAMASRSYRIGFSIGDQQIGPELCTQTNTTENTIHHVVQGPIFRSIPSGSQFKVRATCSGTAEAFDVAAYIVS